MSHFSWEPDLVPLPLRSPAAFSPIGLHITPRTPPFPQTPRSVPHTPQYFDNPPVPHTPLTSDPFASYLRTPPPQTPRTPRDVTKQLPPLPQLKMDTQKTIDPSELFSARGLVIVITGGGSGIGLALASAFYKTSARKIYILGRRFNHLDNAALSVDPSGRVIDPIPCDVTDISSVKTAVEHIADELGYIDVLVNNAGVTGPNHKGIYQAESLGELQDILLQDEMKWETTFATNTTAVGIVSAAFLQLLDKGNQRRGWESGKLTPGPLGRPRARRHPEAEQHRISDGSTNSAHQSIGSIGSTGSEPQAEVDPGDERCSQIITVASIAAFNRHVTASLPYSASKAGAVAIGKSMATFLAPWGIRSNVIAPGIYPSEMTMGAKEEYPYDEIPAGRQGNFDDITSAALYLVGKSGAYVNGNVTITDGGRLSMFQSSY